MTPDWLPADYTGAGRDRNPVAPLQGREDAPTCDIRDLTRDPPAELDPWMVLKARRWMMTDEGWNELKTKREGAANG